MEPNIVGAETTFPSESMSSGGGSVPFLQPYLLQSGVMRGTQTIQNTDGSKVVLGQIPNTNNFGIAFYDPSGNLIETIIGATRSVYTPGATNPVLVEGLLADGTYGTAYYDSSGNLLQKIVGGTNYYYDPSNGGVNSMIVGLLPNGKYGWSVATPGNDVSAAF